MSNTGTEDTRTFTKIQLFKYVTSDRILDITDMLSLDPKRNKIGITLVELDSANRSKSRVRAYVDSVDMKLVCWDILHRDFSEFTDHKGSEVEGRVLARTLTIRKDLKYRMPFVVKIDNGDGEALPGGVVKMVRATDSLTLLMPEYEARRLAITVLDYIRHWETINFRKLQEAQTQVIPLSVSATPPE